MRTQKPFIVFSFVVVAFFASGLLGSRAMAQTPAPSPTPRKAAAATPPAPVIVENPAAAPQVVTILHSLSGLKVFKLLLRSQEQVEAIERLDEGFNFDGEVHTNVIAGLALDDGHTIVAWLPEAEAEMPPPAILFAPRAPGSTKIPRQPGAPAPSPDVKETPSPAVEALPGIPVIPTIPALPAIKFREVFPEAADLRVITRDGKRIAGRYLGLDGLTGLSLITLPGGSFPQAADSKEETINVGQRLRVIGPQPAPRAETSARSAMYVRIAETEALVVSIGRSPSGTVARVRIRSAKLSPVNIGGIAINENGETLGIVDAVEGGDATFVPVALVRMAAKRVIARQASVPRPWLGIQGEPIGALSADRLLRVGWEIERARELTEKRQGILLTKVAPGSPAARANLKPGDLILRVNNGYVRNAEDFSLLLDEVGPESPVVFTIARPEKVESESMEIKLSESPDPWFGLKKFDRYIRTAVRPGSLRAEGVEMVAIKPRVALRLGSTGGLLVVSVEPLSDAFKAGLRPGDVIESIDGQPVFSGAAAMVLPKEPGKVATCIVVRNREKITLTFKYTSNEYPKKP
jgi:serine protease Do